MSENPISGLQIKLLSELTADERRKVFDRYKQRMFFGDRRTAGRYFRLLLLPKYVSFCAFSGQKNLGILVCEKTAANVLVGDNISAHTPKQFLLENKKTVGRILVETAQEYARKNSLETTHLRFWRPGRKLAGRIATGTEDIPRIKSRKSPKHPI